MTQPDIFDWVPPASQSIMGDRDGETFNAKRDGARINAQAQRVWDVMADGRWYSLAEIAAKTFNPETGEHDPEASISARVRDFRKPKFGGFTVEQTCVRKGSHRYKLVLPA